MTGAGGRQRFAPSAASRANFGNLIPTCGTRSPRFAPGSGLTDFSRAGAPRATARRAEAGQSVAEQVAAPTWTFTVCPAAEADALKYTSAVPELSVCQVALVPAPTAITVASG